MAAYAAAVSLKHILDLIENHPSPPISFDKQQLHSLTEIDDFLQEFLEGYVSPYSNRNEADPFEMRIAEAVYAAEDVIESYIVDNIHLAAPPSTAQDDDNDDKDEDDDDDDEDDGDDDGDEDEDEDDDDEDGDYNNDSDDDHNDGDDDDDDDDDDEEGRDNNDDENDDGDVMESCIVDNNHLAATSTSQDDGDGGDDDDAVELYTLDSIQLAAVAAHYEDEQIRYINFYQGLQKVIEVMDFIKKEAMEMAVDKGGLPEADEVQRIVSAEAGSKSSSTEAKIEMVGFEDELLHLKERLVAGNSNREIVPIVGMGGIGKTTLARNVFIDKLILEHFDVCLWATISQDYNIEQTLIEVVSQYREGGHSSEEKKSVAELGQEIHKYLYGRRYLVVLDDMWSIEVWDKMRFYFPECGQGSRVIVTTRMSNLATHLSSSDNSLYMSFLNEVDSWTLFSKAVFGSEGSVVPELRGIGEKIVGKCKGLPLSIAVIGGLLARSELTQDFWEYIEKNLNSIVNMENEEYCLRVLKLSYNHLPAYLKPCFLYMGVFDEDSEIKVSTIINLWVSEGFVKPRKTKNLEAVAWEYFQELVDRNLLLPHKSKQSVADWMEFHELGWVGKNIKWCKMHDLVRDVCLREAQKQRFYYVHGHRDEDCPSSEHHRRIVIPGKTTRDGYQPRTKVESWPYSRSYVCHDYNVKQFPNYRLLRTLHTFYLGSGMRRHPYRLKDVLGLVNSRLLAISLWGGWTKIVLHSCISQLWSLQKLLVYSEIEVEGPVEFWRMHQLKHVEITPAKLHLQLPPNNDDDDIVILENLHTLIGVENFHLNEDVVTRIPNLRILEVYYREVHSLSYLGHLSKLESFRCIIRVGSDVDLQLICFPPSLKEIVLGNGFLPLRLEWEDVLRKIGRLPLVEELMIGGAVFRTRGWETVEGQFPMLKRLELRWCCLEKWTVAEASHFPLLEKLILQELEELEEVPSAIGDIVTLQSIELNYCSESAVLSAKRIVEEQMDLYGEDELSFRVLVTSRDAAALSLASPNFQVEVRKRGY